MYYVYILESQKNGQFYIGQTQNIQQRLDYHNNGRVKSTRYKRPWIIFFYKQYDTRSEAYQQEQKLKSWKNKHRVIQWVEHINKESKRPD